MKYESIFTINHYLFLVIIMKLPLKYELGEIIERFIICFIDNISC